MPTDDLIVSYGLKELLSRFEETLRTGMARLEKGQEDTRREFTSQVEKLESRVTALEFNRRADDAGREAVETVTKKRHDKLMRMWAAWSASAAIGLVVLTWYLSHLTSH